MKKIENLMTVYVRIDKHEHNMHGSESRRGAWPFVDRGPSQDHLPLRGRNGGYGLYDYGGQVGGLESQQARSYRAFGHGPPVPEAGDGQVPQETGSEARTRRPSPRPAGSDRRTTRSSTAVLSALPGAVETLPGDAHALRRRHPRGNHSDRDRTHAPSRLVSTLQETGGTKSSRRPARSKLGQPHGGDDRMDALRPGQHDFANRRSLQLPCADEAYQRRNGASLGTPARGALPLVRTNPSGSFEFGRVACRRNFVASRRQDALVVGLRQPGPDLLHDRPLPGRTGVAAVLRGGIPGHVGQRLLGRLQCRGLCCPPSLPGPSVARLAFRGSIQERWS